MTELLSKEHRILEKAFMDGRPFGTTAAGEKIRDVSGVTVKANAEYLEEVVTRNRGAEAGARAVEELARLLNERIRDSSYHVTPAFLKNPWNSYSYEFVMFLAEFGLNLTGDPHFQFNVGKEKFVNPIIQTLGRPFSVAQIYKMFPHFGQKFAKGSIEFGVGTVTNRSAVLRMKFTDRVYEQFGPYRKRCVELICNSAKAGLASVPDRIHDLKPATIKDLSCIVDGAEYCEWEFTWTPEEGGRFVWPLTGLLVGAVTFGYLHFRYPAMVFLERLAIALLPGIALWLSIRYRKLRKGSRAREALIQEQLRFVEARHEELREAYLEQERTSVELRRKVGQLTTLHRAGLLFGSTLDRETLLQRVLESIIHELHYDRVMLTLYDPVRKVSHDARILGVPDEIAAFARSIEVPVTDPDSLEGTVLLRGQPVLINDIREAWDRVHPFNQQLATVTNTKSIMSVPLKTQDHVRGALTVDRNQESSLTQDDLDLMMTLAGQVAIALDNTDAYRMIETLNVGLELKVQERTTSLEEVNRELGAANTQLRELNHLKSAFVSIVSHELRTPMTSIKGYVENMLEGLTGELGEKQRYYLTRVKHNTERLTRMIGDLLDLSRIEAGRVELKLAPVPMLDLVADVVESFQTIAREKSLTVQASSQNSLPKIEGDRDKLHQVLTNLIQNAVKFTPKGGKVWLETRVRDDGLVECCVADTGCGIPLDEIDKVFDKFFRGESVPADARGAGLGLAITKTLVELHGGRIWVESTPGEGSRFFFTLPIGPSSH